MCCTPYVFCTNAATQPKESGRESSATQEWVANHQLKHTKGLSTRSEGIIIVIYPEFIGQGMEVKVARSSPATPLTLLTPPTHSSSLLSLHHHSHSLLLIAPLLITPPQSPSLRLTHPRPAHSLSHHPPSLPITPSHCSHSPSLILTPLLPITPLTHPRPPYSPSHHSPSLLTPLIPHHSFSFLLLPITHPHPFTPHHLSSIFSLPITPSHSSSLPITPPHSP